MLRHSRLPCAWLVIQDKTKGLVSFILCVTALCHSSSVWACVIDRSCVLSVIHHLSADLWLIMCVHMCLASYLFCLKIEHVFGCVGVEAWLKMCLEHVSWLTSTCCSHCDSTCVVLYCDWSCFSADKRQDTWLTTHQGTCWLTTHQGTSRLRRHQHTYCKNSISPETWMSLLNIYVSCISVKIYVSYLCFSSNVCHLCLSSTSMSLLNICHQCQHQSWMSLLNIYVCHLCLSSTSVLMSCASTCVLCVNMCLASSWLAFVSQHVWWSIDVSRKTWPSSFVERHTNVERHINVDRHTDVDRHSNHMCLGQGLCVVGNPYVSDTWLMCLTQDSCVICLTQDSWEARLMCLTHKTHESLTYMLESYMPYTRHMSL